MMDWQRLSSSCIAILYVIAILASEGWQSAIELLVPLTVPLVLIWQAEAIGEYKGWAGRIPVARTTPPAIIRAFGWGLLLVPAVIYVTHGFIV